MSRLVSLIRRALERRARRRLVSATAEAAGRWTAIYTAEVARLHVEHGGYENRSAYCPICKARVRYAGDGMLTPR